ncbi:MAG: undecaprenyl-diphosphate phosphatase [Treponemataceae bacterium]
MSFLESFFLGAIQGLAEFLPISSSGHLAVAKEFLSLSEVPLLYDVILHIATLLAVVIVYRKTIWRLITVAVRFVFGKTDESDKADLNFILAIIVATFFTGVIGLLLKDVVENLHVKYVSLLFIVTGIILLLSDKIAENKNEDSTIKLRSAVVVGVVQGIAVFPGISRSGSTVATGLFSGISRNRVAEFSFILSIPAILGALVLQLFGNETVNLNVGLCQLAVGFLTALVMGIISLKLLTELLKKAKTKIFSFYLIPLGIILFCYFNFLAV